jgi:hypothetical protein
MSRWFRMYDEVLDDPKVQRLSGDDFKAWVNMLCLASRKDGALPAIEDIGFALRLEAKKAQATVARMVLAGLLDDADGRFIPHGWNARQYKSDVSTGRVKQFRERKKAVAGNGDETFHETAPDTDTDTDTDTENKEGEAGQPATSYAFSGSLIRLVETDLHRWRKTYHAIPDLEAELSVIDGWWGRQTAEKRATWFHATQGMLNRKHQELLAARKTAQASSEWVSPC